MEEHEVTEHPKFQQHIVRGRDVEPGERLKDPDRWNRQDGDKPFFSSIQAKALRQMSGPKDLERLETGQNSSLHRLHGLRKLLFGLEDRNPSELSGGTVH